VEITVNLGELWRMAPEDLDKAVLTEVAVQMRDEVFSEGRNLQGRVADLVNQLLVDEIRAGVRTAVSGVVEMALDDEFTPQDGYGQRGTATSIRAEIKREVQMAAAQLSGSRRDDYARRNSQEFWEKLVGKHAKQLVQDEIGAVVSEIKAGAAMAVRNALAAELNVDLKAAAADSNEVAW
jgi:hypothetical protein